MTLLHLNLKTFHPNRLLVPITLNSTLSTAAFIDSGASENFISQFYVNQHQLPTIKLPQPILLFLGNKSTTYIYHQTQPLQLNIQNHNEIIQPYVVSELPTDIILGFPWLTTHNPYIHWELRRILFFSDLCEQFAILLQQNKLNLYQSTHQLTRSIQRLFNNQLKSLTNNDHHPTSQSLQELSSNHSTQPSAATQLTLPAPVVTSPNKPIQQTFTSTNKLNLHQSTPQLTKSIQRSFNNQLKSITNNDHHPTSQSLQELSSTHSTHPSAATHLTLPASVVTSPNKPIQQKIKSPSPLDLHYQLTHFDPPPLLDLYAFAASIPASGFQAVDQVPLSSTLYPYFDTSTPSHEPLPPNIAVKFRAVFDESNFDKFPPDRGTFNCSITLLPGTRPTAHRPYQTNPKHREILYQWLQEGLTSGRIIPAPTSSSHRSPVFVLKQFDKYRVLMDYRSLNKITIKDDHPIPLIKPMLQRLTKASIYTKLDLKSAYNQIRVNSQDIEKTTFVTEWGLYQSTVMPFGLSNAPSIFQRFMEHLLHDYINQSVECYFDDIVIYSNDVEEHLKLVDAILTILQNNNLYCRAAKCHFTKDSIPFLGYIISPEGISMDPTKITTISNWATPTKRKHVEQFLGFTNFYRELIPNYAQISSPINQLLSKDIPFLWSDVQDKAFKQLIQAFITNVPLQHPDQELPFILETDASGFAISAILSQPDLNPSINIVVPVAFYSRQLKNAELNYHIRDQEMLAIMEALKHWEHFLKGAKHKIQIYTDHRNLEYFTTATKLNDRNKRWLVDLQEYDFEIIYRPGVENTQADILSRLHQYEPPPNHEFQPLIAPSHYSSLSTLYTSTNLNLDIHIDEWPLFIADFLKSKQWGTSKWMDLPDNILKKCLKHLPDFTIRHGCLERFDTKLHCYARYIPQTHRHGVLKQLHEQLGHLKIASTEQVFRQRYWWPSLSQDLQTFIKNCLICQQTASKSGVAIPRQIRPLMPTMTPGDRWGMDFIQNLPRTKTGYRHVLTMIDYATNWVEARPVIEMDTSTVLHMLHTVFTRFGVPREIISDRGSSFLAQTVQDYFHSHGIKHSPSTPGHPPTNGKVEKVQGVTESCIKALARGIPERWDEHLNQSIFAINNRTHHVTKYSAFQLLMGYNPRLPQDSNPPELLTVPLDDKEQLISTTEYTAQTLENLNQARAAAFTRNLAQAKMMELRNQVKDPTNHAFPLNSLVWRKKFNQSSKLEYSWVGPYRIISQGYPFTYHLVEVDTGRFLPTLISQDDLKPLHGHYQVPPNLPVAAPPALPRSPSPPPLNQPLQHIAQLPLQQSEQRGGGVTRNSPLVITPRTTPLATPRLHSLRHLESSNPYRKQ